MATVQSRVISGINEYVSDLERGAKKGKLDFTLVKFDTEVQEVAVGKSIEKFGRLTARSYAPNGMTALYDAVYKTIVAAGEWLSKQKDKYRVLCVIQTDGQENSSRLYNEKQVSELVRGHVDGGFWTFVFLGADQDAWANAQRMGIHDNAYRYTSINTHNVIGGRKTSLGSATMNYMNAPVAQSSNFWGGLTGSDDGSLSVDTPPGYGTIPAKPKKRGRTR
jgi:hypothetical protein